MTLEQVGRVVQVNVNPKGGAPKYPVPTAEISAEGVAGDKQRNRRFHTPPCISKEAYF